MKTLTDGPYLYRTRPKSIPIVCEICASHVWEVGNEFMRPLSHYEAGKFTRLVEADDATATMPPEATEVA